MSLVDVAGIEPSARSTYFRQLSDRSKKMYGLALTWPGQSRSSHLSRLTGQGEP